jgi:hypothetical protein
MSRRLPNGEYTNSEKKCCDAWDAFVKPLADATGTQLASFDPTVTLSDGRNSVQLPLWFVANFNAAQQIAPADLLPCGHPRSRLNIDYTSMSCWCMDCEAATSR